MKKCLGLLLLALSLTNSAFAEEESNVAEFDLRTIKCGQFLALNEQSRDYLFFFLYGFHSGVNKQFLHSVPKIEKAVESVGDLCVKNTELLVLDALGKQYDAQ